MEILGLVIHHWSYSILTENIRKLEVFLMFSGGIERHRGMKCAKYSSAGKPIYRQIIGKPVASEQTNIFQ